MGAVDFADWAVPDLVLTLGGNTYRVSPPSVERARQVLACTVRSEINLGLATGPVPPELSEVLEELDRVPLGMVTLGEDVYSQLVRDGHPPITIDRMAYYGMLYWARGKARADMLASVLWAPKPEDPDDAPGEVPGR